MAAPPTPSELLGKLAAMARRRQRGEPLRTHVVSLLMQSGRTVRGTLINMQDAVVALEMESGALVVVELSALEGLILESPADAFRPPEELVVPSNLALRKLAEKLGCEVAHAEESEERCALADTLKQLGLALSELREDSESATVLAGITLGLDLGEHALITREEDHIQITRARGWPDRLLAETLRDALEDVL